MSKSRALPDPPDAWSSTDLHKISNLQLLSPVAAQRPPLFNGADTDMSMSVSGSGGGGGGGGDGDGTTAESSRDMSRDGTRQPSYAYGRLTRESLEALSAAQDDSNMSLYPYSPGEAGPSRRKEDSAARRLDGKMGGRIDRMNSAESTSSEESDAGAEDDERDEMALAQEAAEEEEIRRELSAGEGGSARWLCSGKGKGKEDRSVMGTGSVASTLPAELLIQIFRLLDQPRDIINAMLVSKDWCLSAFQLIWQRPNITAIEQYCEFAHTVSRPQRRLFLPYARAVRRINLLHVASMLRDDLMEPLKMCTRCERLSITNATKLSPQALSDLISQMPDLIALDLSGCTNVDDQVLHTMAKSNPRLQGINLTGCKRITDTGLMALAGKLPLLRRLKLRKCQSLTDVSLLAIVRSCPLMLELELSNTSLLTDATVFGIFLHSKHLRDFRLTWHTTITSAGFPLLEYLSECTDAELQAAAQQAGSYADVIARASETTDDDDEDLEADHQPSATVIPRPVTDLFDNLRVVDLTGCAALTDEAVANLVTNGPRIRNLTLAKCTNLTNKAVYSICELGKHLHYLHLGHVSAITDEAVIKLATSCTRLRYIDLACCALLTDQAVIELANNLPKLRRIGLVKVTNLTDRGIYALVERHSTLERMHLSYCNQITLGAATFMLNRLLRLTHLSLTGVAAFRSKELQQFCRPCPPDFTAHQQAAFCVYSGSGISALRDYLNAQFRSNNAAGSDYETSTRRGSSSSTSSIVPVTGTGTGAGNTPPPVTHGQRSSATTYSAPIQPSQVELAAAYAAYHQHVREDNTAHEGFQSGNQASAQPGWQPSGSGTRRISDPNTMSHTSSPHSGSLPRGMLPSPLVPDPLPLAFASVTPNFLRPSGLAGSSTRIERSGSRPPITSITRPSRASSASSSAALSAGEDSPRPWSSSQQQQQLRHRHVPSASVDRATPDTNAILPRMARSDSPMQIDPAVETPHAREQHRYSEGSPFAAAGSGRLPGMYNQPAGGSTAGERIEFPVPVPSPNGARHRGYSGSHAMSGPAEPYIFTSGRRASAVPMTSSSSHSGIHNHHHHHLHHRPHLQSSHAMLAASPFPLLPSQGYEGGGGYHAPLGSSAPGSGGYSSPSGRHSPAALGGLPLGQQYPYTNVESQVPYHSPTDYVRHNGTGTRPRRSGSASEAITHLVTTVGSTAVSAATAVAGGVAAAAGVGAAGVVGGGGRARGESVSSRLRWVADIVGWGTDDDSQPATESSAQQQPQHQHQHQQRSQEACRAHEQEHLMGGDR